MTSGIRTDTDPGRERRPPTCRRRILLPAAGLALYWLLPSPRVFAQTAATASTGPWTLAQLLGEMTQRKQARARFVERQFLAVLDAPVDSSGELLFEAPGKLEKRTLKPRPELLAVDGNELRVQRGDLKRTMSLQQMPEAAALIESLRATLNGDQAVLDKVFQTSLQGTRDKWQLVLVPRDSRALAIVRRITLSGVRNDVQGVEIEQNDGDRSVMRILDTQ